MCKYEFISEFYKTSLYKCLKMKPGLTKKIVCSHGPKDKLKSIGVKNSLILLGGGGPYRPCHCFDHLFGQKLGICHD